MKLAGNQDITGKNLNSRRIRDLATLHYVLASYLHLIAKIWVCWESGWRLLPLVRFVLTHISLALDKPCFLPLPISFMFSS